MAQRRLPLQRGLAAQARAPATADPHEIRELSEAALEPLAELMISAYRGTVDDEGETVADASAELTATFGGKYGGFMPHASLAAWRDRQLASAVVVTLYKQAPLFAFCMTAASVKRQGLCQMLRERSMAALAREGWRRSRLYVTAANTPAMNLYRKLRFEDDTAESGE